MSRALLIGIMTIMAIVGGRQLAKSMDASKARITSALDTERKITTHRWIKD
jgi:hypothetical protein